MFTMEDLLSGSRILNKFGYFPLKWNGAKFVFTKWEYVKLICIMGFSNLQPMILGFTAYLVKDTIPLELIAEKTGEKVNKIIV